MTTVLMILGLIHTAACHGACMGGKGWGPCMGGKGWDGTGTGAGDRGRRQAGLACCQLHGDRCGEWCVADTDRLTGACFYALYFTCRTCRLDRAL